MILPALLVLQGDAPWLEPQELDISTIPQGAMGVDPAGSSPVSW